MKKILFATLMFLGVAVVSSAQAPAKTTTTHKKEATKPASTVSSVSPTATANTKTATKPATTSTTKAATTDAGKKHKKHHSAPKKEPKK